MIIRKQSHEREEERMTREEAWDLLKSDIDINGSGGWDCNYICDFINANWEE